jgi:superfamily II DNA or RNA helicase
MGIKDLVNDPRTSIDEAVASSVDAGAFSAAMRRVQQYGFWSGRSKPALWEHQRQAIETVVAYLSADPHLPERPNLREAALLKLPTGTGKSGIIAVLARCLPDVNRTLVLTPRESLVEQMIDDVRFRFWDHLGYRIQEGCTFAADASEMGADLSDVYVETLLPSRSDRILQHVPAAAKSVLVGTYQALDLIRRRARDKRPERAAKAKAAQEMLDLLACFDLVLVDEGHYEPAISWSKGVRDLNRATVLLSATPYRNDFKSFRVRGRFVFNYPHRDAVATHVIRDTEIVQIETRGSGSAADKFVGGLARRLPLLISRAAAWTDAPKIMIRADDLDTLQDLQRRIDRTFRTKSVLVHDRAAPSPKYPRRYHSVRPAMRECGDARFWLHQYKLMEGVDDPDFIVAAIYDLHTNGRQLIQQIGRVVRTSPGRPRKQTAWVMATKENTQRIEATWRRYKAYETYCAAQTRHIVVNEIALPDRLLQFMPDNQYIGGDFRERFNPAAPLSMADLQLPASAAVFKWKTPARAVAELSEAAEDALMEKDRFKIVPIEGLPANCIGCTYYAWRNSPLLVDKFFSEWKLGVFIAVQHHDLIMVHDTEGNVLDMEALGLETAPRRMLEQAFPADRTSRPSRLTRMSFGSLDMSEQAIRTLAVRTRAFETTFTDLLDPNLVPTAASGFVGGKGRYIGFANARFRDSSERRLPMKDYLMWTRSVARELTGAGARSGVFDRYAVIRDDITPDGARPQSILLNLSRDELLEETDPRAEARTLAADPDIDHDDVCADVDAEGKFTIKVVGKPVECQISFNPETGRYRFHSEDLNDLFRTRETGDRAHAQTASQRIAAQQSFRILVAEPNVVYAEKRFFEPRITLKLPDGSTPILDDVHTVKMLADAKSEKGEGFFSNRARWRAESIFGAVDGICQTVNRTALRAGWQELGLRLGAYPLIVCDDDAKEIADFIALDPEEKRIAFVHAKANKDGTGTYNVDSLQAVGRQATASLAFLARYAPVGNWHPDRWPTDVRANKVSLSGRNRIFKNTGALSVQQISDALASACGNPTYDREVWIVAGNMVDRSAVAGHILAGTMDNRLRQFLMHWDGLRTACARAGARLLLFCH